MAPETTALGFALESAPPTREKAVRPARDTLLSPMPTLSVAAPPTSLTSSMTLIEGAGSRCGSGRSTESAAGELGLLLLSL